MPSQMTGAHLILLIDAAAAAIAAEAHWRGAAAAVVLLPRRREFGLHIERMAPIPVTQARNAKASSIGQRTCAFLRYVLLEYEVCK